MTDFYELEVKIAAYFAELRVIEIMPTDNIFHK